MPVIDFKITRHCADLCEHRIKGEGIDGDRKRVRWVRGKLFLIAGGQKRGGSNSNRDQDRPEQFPKPGVMM